MYFDVYWELCSNSAFRKEITKRCDEIIKLEQAACNNRSAGDLLAKKLLEFYTFCNNNPGLLVPHFFPDYPKKGVSLNLIARPFAFSMFNFQAGGWVVVRASRQIGKCLGFNELLQIRLIETPENTVEKEISAVDLFSVACALSDG